MSRRNRKHYAGATGTIKPLELERLGSAFRIQPKADGAYCHLHLDRFGCIARVSSRTGRDFDGDSIRGLVGQFVGYPGAVLVGELMAHTEGGNKDAAEFGARRVFLFDIAFGYDTAPLHHLAYASRRDELYRMQAKVEAFGPGQTFVREWGRSRDRSSGRYCRKTHRGTALTPILPQYLPSQCGELWDRVRAGELEGLVAVSQRAKLGARSSKRKCKPVEHIDAIVVQRGPRTATVIHNATQFRVTIGKRDVCPGDVLEIAHNGWYGSSRVPRFPRVVRLRDDMAM